MALLIPYEFKLQNRLMAASPAMSSGVPEDPIARARAMIAAAREGAPQGIDPRMAAILDRRLQRADEQERELQRAQKGTVWEALMRAGTAMASNQSPFFAPALAAGANAALSAVQQRRAEAARARMGIADMRDDVEMERIKQEGAGMRAADEGLERVLRIGNQLGEADLRAAQAMKARAEAIPDPQMRALELRKAEMQIREIESKIAENRAQAVKALREGSGVSSAPPELQRQLDSALTEFEEVRQLWNQNYTDEMWRSSEEGRRAAAKLMAARERVNRISRGVMKKTGVNPGTFVPSSGAFSSGSGRTAAMNNDPLGLRGQR